MVGTADFLALMPVIIIAVTSITVMVLIAVRRNHFLTAFLTLIGLAAAFDSLKFSSMVLPRSVTSILVMDSYALFFDGIIIATSFAVAILCYNYMEKHDGDPEELYLLLLVATFGAMILVSTCHFVSLFLGLEILSISLYAMIAYFRDRRVSIEAGIKYLILAAASAAFLLFGMALIYADLGTLEFHHIGELLGGQSNFRPELFLPGLALIVTGIGFKLGVVPFHMWTPDVYEGSPSPVTTYIATVSKGAVFGLLLRYVVQSGAGSQEAARTIISIVAVASMFFGNLLALLQNNVKRILAYSSIAHLGYLLAAFGMKGNPGLNAATFYIIAYLVTTLGAFGIITVLSHGGRDADRLEDYRGLFRYRPVTAAVFTTMLLSLAGMPLTAGFLAKFYIIAAGVTSPAWMLVFALVVSSVIGLFYYLRVVVIMFQDRPATVDLTEAHAEPMAISDRFVLAALVVLLIWFGVYPSPIMDVIDKAIAGLS